MSDESMVVLVFGVVLVLLAGVVLAVHQRDEFKEQAVKRGFAEWIVSSNGAVKWQWKEVAK